MSAPSTKSACPNSLPTEATESDVTAMFNDEQRGWASGRRISLASILISLLSTYAGLSTAIVGFALDSAALVLAGIIVVGSAAVLV